MTPEHIVVLPLGSQSLPDATNIISSVEAALIEGAELVGNLRGSGKTTFFVRAKRRQLQQLIVDISCRLGLADGFLVLSGSTVEERAKSRNSGRRPSVFDLWSVPLPHGEFGYLQILDKHEEFLHLVRAFDLTSTALLPAPEILKAGLIFPPVYTLVSPKTVTASKLSYVGHFPVKFAYPLFRHGNLSMLYPDRYDDDWTIWSPERGYEFVGRLTDQQRDMECLTVWPLETVVERIAKRIGPREISRLGGIATGLS